MAFNCDCDGARRRDFLKLGMLGLGNLSLPSFLGAQTKSKEKSFIFVWLAGGPPQMDMYDMKPDAPGDIRGEFKPVRSKLSGLDMCELLPKTAAVADKLCLLRSVTSVDLGSHERSSRYLQTGVLPVPNMDFASFGSVFTKEKKLHGEMPPFVGVQKPIERGWGGGFLGSHYDPFMAGDPNEKNYRVRDLLPPQGITLDRIGRRREILNEFNQAWRTVDTEAKLNSYSPAVEQAYNMVYSEKVLKAFDIHAEPEKMRDTYGRTQIGQGLLMARRLVENGVRAVSVWMGGWDTHSNNFTSLKSKLLPPLDMGFGALVADLDQRGLLENTLVVQIGEFGRTPKVNKQAGRDHWPKAFSVVLAGGGMKRGTVIGATDKHAAEVTDRPITVEDLSATIFTALGVDIHALNHTPEGRPIAVVNGGKPVAEAFA
ncbi:MAG: DUF1501 domain-containing protein [Candidatus Solibacter usitatus]|nr:DUF1501 domain-containing protein [Candidatus Solibacter usitatus]